MAQDLSTYIGGLARMGRDKEEVDKFLETIRRYRWDAQRFWRSITRVGILEYLGMDLGAKV